MKRLLVIPTLLLPICLFAQGFGSFSGDQPFLAGSVSSSLPNPIFWYTTTNSTLINTNGVAATTASPSLQKWNDSIGSGNNAYRNTNNGGTFSGYSLYGADGVFQAFQNVAGSGNYTNGVTIQQPYTLFVMASFDNSPGSAACVTLPLSSSSSFLQRDAHVGNAIYSYNTPGGTMTGPGSAVYTGLILFTVYCDGANSFIRTNGVFYTNGVTGGALTNFSIGGTGSSGTAYNGNYAEIRAYGGDLLTNQMAAIEQQFYLTHIFRTNAIVGTDASFVYITNLVAHYDISRLENATNTVPFPIFCVTDIYTNNYNIIGFSYNAPRLTNNASYLNALPWIDFDGFDDFMSGTSPSYSQPVTVFFVGDIDYNAPATFATHFGFGPFSFYSEGADTLHIYAGNQLDWFAAPAKGTFRIWIITANGGSSSIEAVGTGTQAGNAGASAGTLLQMGGNSAASFPSRIKFAKLLYYNAVVSGASKTNVVTYLKNRYNVTGY